MSSPTVKLYASNGITLVYTFPFVQKGLNVPHTESKSVPIEGVRAKGGLLAPGGTKMWDLIVPCMLTGETIYDDVTDLIIALETAVTVDTRFVIKIDKDVEGASQWSYNVKRTAEIDYLPSFRRYKQPTIVTFVADCW